MKSKLRSYVILLTVIAIALIGFMTSKFVLGDDRPIKNSNYNKSFEIGNRSVKVQHAIHDTGQDIVQFEILSKQNSMLEPVQDIDIQVLLNGKKTLEPLYFPLPEASGDLYQVDLAGQELYYIKLVMKSYKTEKESSTKDEFGQIVEAKTDTKPIEKTVLIDYRKMDKNVPAAKHPDMESLLSTYKTDLIQLEAAVQASSFTEEGYQKELENWNDLSSRYEKSRSDQDTLSVKLSSINDSVGQLEHAITVSKSADAIQGMKAELKTLKESQQEKTIELNDLSDETQKLLLEKSNAEVVCQEMRKSLDEKHENEIKIRDIKRRISAMEHYLNLPKSVTVPAAPTTITGTDKPTPTVDYGAALKLAVFRAGEKTSYKVGEPVNLAARAEGGKGELKYQFYALNSKGKRIELTKLRAVNTFTWIPENPDKGYKVCVDIVDESGQKISETKSITVTERTPNTTKPKAKPTASTKPGTSNKPAPASSGSRQLPSATTRPIIATTPTESHASTTSERTNKK